MNRVKSQDLGIHTPLYKESIVNTVYNSRRASNGDCYSLGKVQTMNENLSQANKDKEPFNVFSKRSKDYIENRLQDQIDWYSSKSSFNQKIYKGLQKIEILAATASPIIGGIGLAYQKYSIIVTIIISILGSVIACIESIEKLSKYHENWINYRSVSELLKHEKYLYLTQTEPYTQEDSFNLLVLRVERIISSENVNWVGINDTAKNRS